MERAPAGAPGAPGARIWLYQVTPSLEEEYKSKKKTIIFLMGFTN